MTKATSGDIREALLLSADELKNAGGSLQLTTLFRATVDKVGGRNDQTTEEQILSEWHELVRSGIFAWGYNLDNPNPPFFHFTDRGVRAGERMNRDPSNPKGYLRHLESVASLNPIADAYLREALQCFVSGLNKAAAVMLGASSETMVIELIDQIKGRAAEIGSSIPKGLTDWRIKVGTDALHTFLSSRKTEFEKKLRDDFEAYFSAFAMQIRSSRNEAGHPGSVEAVTEDSVHASFLVFPELARLSASLSEWIKQFN